MMRPTPKAPLFNAPFPGEDLRTHATLVCDGTSCPGTRHTTTTTATTPLPHPPPPPLDRHHHSHRLPLERPTRTRCSAFPLCAATRLRIAYPLSACWPDESSNPPPGTDLLNAAYMPASIDTQMDAAVTGWMANPWKGMRIDRTNDTVYWSKIMSWFGDEFEAQGGITKACKPY